MADATTPAATPTINELITSASTATPADLQTEANSIVHEAIEDLAAGKSPLSSDTIRTALVVVLLGIVGIAYQAYQGGTSLAQLGPYLLTVLSGVAMGVLRFMTSTPILTEEMSTIISAVTNAKTATAITATAAQPATPSQVAALQAAGAIPSTSAGPVPPK